MGRRIMAERRRIRRTQRQREVQRIRTDPSNQIDARADDQLRVFVRILARQAAREVFEAEWRRHSETIQ
jgi:hypothetical protein